MDLKSLEKEVHNCLSQVEQEEMSILRLISHSRHIKDQKLAASERSKAKSIVQEKSGLSEARNLGRRASSFGGLELHKRAVKTRAVDDFEKLIKEIRTKVEDVSRVRP